jgi:hypothetical protein
MPIPSGHIKDSRSGLDFTAKADPHPLKAPGIATHSVKVDNQRPTAVYQVDIVSRALFGQVGLTLHHVESKVPQTTARSAQGSISVPAGSEN